MRPRHELPSWVRLELRDARRQLAELTRMEATTTVDQMEHRRDLAHDLDVHHARRRALYREAS